MTNPRETRRKKTNTNNRTANNDIFHGGHVPTPKEIVAYLDQHVIGQEKAKKRLAVAVYNHFKRILSKHSDINIDEKFRDVKIDKSNIILLGDTGSGKTFLLQNIAKMLGVPFHIHDCTKLTAAGYVGEDVENILVGLLQDCDYDVDLAQYGIVCLDEVDKIARKSGENMSVTRDVSGECVQQSLLKIVEGNIVGVMPQGGRKHPEQPLIPVDTSNILFIGMGAFVGIENIVNKRTNVKKPTIGFTPVSTHPAEDEIPDDDHSILDDVLPTDLIKFGMIPEFIGRFPVITHTSPLLTEDLTRIISEPKNAILKQYQMLAYLDGKDLQFAPDAIKLVAEAAILSGTGARGIRGILEEILNDFMFDISDSRAKKFKVTKEYCENILQRRLKYVN